MGNNLTLITGATGFVGSHLCARLKSENRDLRCSVRNRFSIENSVVVGDIGPDTPWGEALTDVDTVVHLAARVHIMKDTISDPLAEFRLVNVDATLNLARQAVIKPVQKNV